MELLKNHTNHLADHFLLNWNPVPHLWRAIAFKEAHEICINEDLKTAITYLQNTSLFMNCRIKLTKKVCETIILLADINSTHESTIIDKPMNQSQCERVIITMIKIIPKNNLPYNLIDWGITNTSTWQAANTGTATQLAEFSQGMERKPQNHTLSIKIQRSPHHHLKNDKMLTETTGMEQPQWYKK